MDELEFASARGLADAVAERRISALELVDAAIKRIECRDAGINAVVVRDFERAREAAGAVDLAVAAGRCGPLCGVPITVKESNNVAGLPTTWGMPPFAEWIAPADAVGVARLKAAGAVVLGKTNVPTMLTDWQTANPLHGRTCNPWNTGRTPGGSSGGAAAAVASGMSALELGSDLGGSIRVPAAFCGVLGHKPSFGLVPMRGAAPPGVDGVPPPLAVIGPLARCAEDLDLALDVLAGPDPEERKGYRLALPESRHDNLASFRVLVADDFPGVALDDEIRGALQRLAADLARWGATVDHPGTLPFDPGPGLDCLQRMIGVITSRGGDGGAAAAVTAHEWMDLLDTQLGVRRAWAALFDSVDVVLTPAFGTTAFEHCDTQPMSDRALPINGEMTPYAMQGVWSSLATVANLPATAFPVGLSSQDGLPIGLQAIGPYLEDRTTIAFARLLERELGGFRRPPPAA